MRQGTLYPIVAPGSAGLNLTMAGSLLDPAFATKADNAVIDSAGRLAGRRGYQDLTSTDITANAPVKSMHEYLKPDGTTEVIIAWDGGISNDVADPETSDISGALTDTNGYWSFANFNSKCLAFQDGQKLAVYTGTTFATVTESSGTAPSGGIATAAFGRVWQLDTDDVTIKYSGLLDETDWGGAGAGSIDMSNIWTNGMDVVTGIEAYNGTLVVFGKRHIIFWNDGTGSQLGLDPTNMVVSDVIEGTGCLAARSIQLVGETDLLFLSANGVQSIERLLINKSRPISNLSKNVREPLLENVSIMTDVSTIASTYNPLHGFYLLSIQEAGITWVFDQNRKYQDEVGDVLSIATKWLVAPHSLLTLSDNSLYLGSTWGVGNYTGYLDGADPINFSYQSPWMHLGDNVASNLKILKRIVSIIYSRASTTLTFKWSTDFNETFKTASRTVDAETSAEWGIAEWNVDEWSGGFSLRVLRVPARDSGQYYRIALDATITGTFAIQLAQLFTKVGRIA